MKTLLFTLEFPPFKGGIANYYGHLVKYWPFDETLLVLNNNRGELLAAKGWLRWLKAIPALNRQVKREKIDYVLVGQILPLGTTAWLLSLLRPLRYGILLHGLDFAWALKSERKRWLTRRILRRAQAIIAANRYVAEKVKEFLPALRNKVEVINPGIELAAPLAEAKLLAELKEKYALEGKIVLFTLGRLVRRKGVDYVLQALRQIPRPLSDNLLYFIAGTGPDENYLRQLVPENWRRQITFLGEINEAEKWAWLYLTDVFLMPAREVAGDFEGFGIVYLEANLCAKAVIAGRAGGVSDAVIDGVNGLLVDPLDINAIKEALIKLAENPVLRQKLGESGKKRAQTEFNWEKQTMKLVSLIKTGLKPKG